MKKRKKFSKQSIENIRQGTIKAMANPLVRKKMRLAKLGKPSNFKGKKFTLEQRKKISKSLKGRIPWNKGLKDCYKLKQNEDTIKRRKLRMMGCNNPSWKGDEVEYGGVHSWLRKVYGRADFCENQYCSKKSKNFEWSNISGKYKRDRKDYMKLCRSCHRKYDKGTLSIVTIKGD